MFVGVIALYRPFCCYAFNSTNLVELMKFNVVIIPLCVTSILLGSFGGIPAISFVLWLIMLSMLFDCL